MGGTAGHILRCLAYDPMIWAARCAAGAASPTFVDDLAALVMGAAHVLVAQFVLIVAGHAAGPLTEPHVCSGAGFDVDLSAVARQF